jgi:uroporphyrinogen-III synthase
VSRERILITRANPGAMRTARLLANKGLMPIVEPLFVLEPIAEADLPDNFDALAFTSANGVRMAAGLTQQRDLPVFCVGTSTAEIAKASGFSEVYSADGDVAALERLILKELPAGAIVVHAANEEAIGDLASHLKAGGLEAVHVPLYRGAAVEAPGPILTQHLSGDSWLDAALIHSPRAARILASFLEETPGHAPLPIAAISAAAAAPLRDHVAMIEISAKPDEPALLAALGRLLAQLD